MEVRASVSVNPVVNLFRRSILVDLSRPTEFRSVRKLLIRALDIPVDL